MICHLPAAPDGFIARMLPPASRWMIQHGGSAPPQREEVAGAARGRRNSPACLALTCCLAPAFLTTVFHHTVSFHTSTSAARATAAATFGGSTSVRTVAASPLVTTSRQGKNANEIVCRNRTCSLIPRFGYKSSPHQSGGVGRGGPATLGTSNRVPARQR